MPVGATGRAVRSLPDAIPDGGIQQLKMDEGSGTTVSDSINSYDASLINDAQWQSDSGSVGGSRIDFPSPPDAIETEIRLSEDYGAGAITILPDSWSSSGYDQVIDGESDSNSNRSHLVRNQDGTFEFLVRSGGSWVSVSASSLPPTGSKTRVGYRIDGSNLTIFYNGSIESETAHSGTLDNWIWNAIGYRKYTPKDGSIVQDRASDVKVDNFINFATSTVADLPDDQWFADDYKNQPWS